MGSLDGIFLIIHPIHLRKGTNPLTATTQDLGRKPTMAMIFDGIAVENKGSFHVLKTRSGAKHPLFDKEVTAELTPEGRLRVVRGEPGKRALDAMSALRREWKLSETAKYHDNCPCCGAWVQFQGAPGYVEPVRHMAPCGIICQGTGTFLPAPTVHSLQTCSAPHCSGGITDPYITIREVSPNRIAYDRWGGVVAKLPPDGVQELLTLRPFVKVWV